MKKLFVLTRGLTLLAALAAMFLSSGCIIPKVYIDPQYRAPAMSDIAPATPKPVRLTVTGLTNSAPNKAASRTWTKEVSAALQKSKVFVLSDAPDAATLDIQINNVADTGDAMKKGFVTGLTFGLAGSTVTDRYVMTATLKETGADTFSGEYKHAIHTVIGADDAPINGVSPRPLREAPGRLAEDMFLNFVRDYRSNATLAPAAAR